MAPWLLSLSCILFSQLVAAQNNSPEDSGPASPSSTYTPPPRPDQVDNAAGAQGAGGGYSLSTGGEIAIIVVVVIVALLGVGSAILFYVAKKRQWEVRKTIKRASRRVVSKVDPRQSRQSRAKGMVRMQSPPPTAKTVDLEKGNGAKTTTTPNDKSKRQAMQIDDTNTKPAPERKFKTVLPDSWTVGGKK